MNFEKIKKWICSFKSQSGPKDLRTIRAREQALEKVREVRTSVSIYLGGL